MVTRVREAPTKPLIAEFPHFAYGAGAFDHVPGYYAIAQNGDCRWGPGLPGLREVVDRTGIAAGFRVWKYIRQNDIQWVLTYNGTDTRLYRIEAGVWTQKLAVVTTQGTDIVSFAGVIAVGLGASTAYQFSSDNGTTWTSSTKTGNAKYFNYALVQQNRLVNPRVTYVRNPNELYFTADLTNAGASTTSTTIGDNQTAQDTFRSLTEDDLGTILIGKRHALFSVDATGAVTKLTPDYPDEGTDAGGQGDRPNFEAYTQIEGRTYYIVNGYEIIEYYHGRINEYIAPKWAGPLIPRMHLPVNAITKAGEWLLAALGTKNTLKGFANAPGGTALYQNSAGTTSDIWAGRYQPNPQTGQVEFVWHGVLLTTTSALRYMWWDEDDTYLYMASGDSETVNNQQRRAYFSIVPPQYQLVSSIINMATGAYIIETGRIHFGDQLAPKRAIRLEARTVGLASTTPSLEVLYRPQPDYEATAYTSLVTWTDNYHPEIGVKFPSYQTFRVMNLQFKGTGSAANNTYAVLLGAKLEAELYTPMGIQRV